MRSVKLPRLVPSRPVPPPPAAPGDVLAAAGGLRVHLGGRPVLDGVDVEVRAGEVLASSRAASPEARRGDRHGDRDPRRGSP